MSARKVTLAGWVALVLGLLFVLLQSYGWWNEVQARGDQGDWLEQWAITTHVLPTLLLVASVALGWRWPLVGAIGFLAYSVVMVFSYYPEWAYAPLVTGPTVVIGVLFLIDSWLRRRSVTAAPRPST
ncbi:hypothetical protein SAMN05216282_10158 [Cryobacterium psychrotolerans]|uniref:DUF7670 domain-containing protein n=1 Tax=Cryobacterium psychrotolerans TaxID=386301 RepID=A0A1G8X200_9MICO|nr:MULTISPECIES: hypothetical protein [Cryobacterium]TFD46660.1 hypothetical protein E3T33_04845 [Cryobacterium sp. TMT1-2-1]TFD83055.1 hypothetical protein E3T56_15130 [Cryobacterium psychrotolerans]SDJ84563.1 hypothetical protein SAMN05216282_10158 [Cryobacterium psychrotolerans]